MRPTDSLRGFDEDGLPIRSNPMTGQTLLNWGSCRTEMGIMLVAGVFLTIGLSLLLYIEMMATALSDDPVIAVAIIPAMTMFLYLGGVMVIVALFIGGAPSEAGGSGWSLGTRVSFLALLLSIVGLIYLVQASEPNKNNYKLFIYLFAGELALVIIFWSLYQRGVAQHVGSNAAAGATIPFLLLGVACVGLYAFNFLESFAMLGGIRRARYDREDLAKIATGALVVLALYQTFLAGAIRSGITRHVLSHMPK